MEKILNLKDFGIFFANEEIEVQNEYVLWSPSQTKEELIVEPQLLTPKSVLLYYGSPSSLCRTFCHLPAGFPVN